MRAPLFWGKRGVISTLLWPLEQAWIFGARRRLAKGPWERLDIPVICVGNINAGGTGKTPSVIALLEMLAKMGVRAHVVSRGYGGSLDGPVLVEEQVHKAADVGDEPLLISAFGPCWVSKDRAAGAKAAIAAGAEVIILDDGFQNPVLVKDFSIVVVDAEVGFGNGRCMPAGPLREPLTDGLARADIVLSIGGNAAQTQLFVQSARWQAQLQPLETGMEWKGTRVLAFAGIGRPGKFFATLKGLGADIVATREFADHAPYTDTVLKRLLAEANAKSAQLVSTEKDIARLPDHFKREVIALPVRLEFDDPEAVKAALENLLAARRAENPVDDVLE